MMAQAREKWDKMVRREAGFSLLGLVASVFSSEPAQPLKAEFVVSDASNLTARFGEQAFDTVVDTFGVCSFHDPVEVLRELSRVCKPEGKILLLEHGIGSYKWMQDYQEQSLPKHVATWGCFFNRDIEKIVRQAGLKVESISRHHLGTTYVIIASPPAHTP